MAENGPIERWDHLNMLAQEIDDLRQRELNTLVARFFADNPGMKAEDAVLVEDRQGSVTRWYMEKRATHCHAARDGDCSWESCPQTWDGEPGMTGRSCPLEWPSR